MAFIYLSIEHILAIHETMIQEFGGSSGVRSQELLDSAIHQPMQSFGGEDLYSTLFEKAAAYAFFISENQPFVDGNKRTAASAAAIFLDIHGYEINCRSGEIYKIIMKLANKKISQEKLAKWFEKNSIKKEK